jgi:hypothetical protein
MRNGTEHFIARAGQAGWLTEDVDCTYVGSPDEPIKDRIYYVQEDGGQNTRPYWTEPTKKSLQKYLREDLRNFPDAMILKTKYIG